MIKLIEYLLKKIIPTEKYCKFCGEYKPIEEFQAKKRSTICKDCLREERREVQKKYVEETGGDRILLYPGQYTNEFQKTLTFEVLTSIGWSFNEENRTWYKLPIKLPDGTFPDIPESKRSVKRKPSKCKLSPELIKQIRDLTSQGYTPKEIELMTGISDTSVYKYR